MSLPGSLPIPSTTGFNKSKEDFIWFVKKAVSDHSSDAHAELYHCLLKMFVDADTNEDGLVSKGSFSKCMDMLLITFQMFGYAPCDADVYKTEEEKEKARQDLFDKMDLMKTGVITFDEWYRFCMEQIAAKTATIAPHPILDHGNKEEIVSFLKAAMKPGSAEETELYWYLVEIFTDCDKNRNGYVTKRAFSTMMEKLIETPRMPLVNPDEVMYDEDEAIKTAFLEGCFLGSNPRGDDKMTLDEWVGFARKVFLKLLNVPGWLYVKA